MCISRHGILTFFFFFDGKELAGSCLYILHQQIQVFVDSMQTSLQSVTSIEILTELQDTRCTSDQWIFHTAWYAS